MAAGDRKIQITIGADGSVAVEGIDRVKSALGGMEQQSQSIFSRMKQHWLGMAAGITAAYLALQKMWAFMDAAAKFEERMDTLNQLTSMYGQTSDQLVGQIQNVSRGLIGAAAAADVATDALAKGFTPDQVVRMAALAETLAETSSESMTTADAIRQMETALVSARERGVVKMFGATIDLETALGREAATLSKAEKAQKLYELAMVEGEKRKKALGDAVDSAADRMERFQNSMDEAKRFFGSLILLVGQPFMAVFNVALTLVYSLAGGVMTVISTVATLTDELGITTGKAEQYQKKAEELYERAAKQAVQAGINMRAAFDQIARFGEGRSGGGGAVDRNADANLKRQEQLTEIVRKFSEERDVINAAEREKDLVRLEFWFQEQQKKLSELGAADAQYSQLVETYAVKRTNILVAQANKESEFYLDVQRQRAKEADEIEKSRIKAEFDERERGAKERLDLENRYAKVWGESETVRIQRQGEGEREILSIRQQGLIASITEQTTFVETLAIMQQYRDLELEIEESKRRQVVDLDVRRLEIEREIHRLTIQQDEILRQSNLQTGQEALGRIGGGAIGDTMGLASDIEAGEDRYMQDFLDWAEKQDAKIQYLEEIGASEAEIKDAWRQRDLQQEAMMQQQKVALASSSLGAMSSLMQAFYAASGQRNKAFFNLYKGFAIAQATMDTYAAFNAALKGPPGPPWSYAIAAATLAMGLSKVSQIASMQPGGSASASVGGGGGGYSSPSIPSLPAAAPAPAAKAETTKIINVHIYSEGSIGVDDESLDKFARKIVGPLEKAWDDNAQ